jgi:hypothetical protein
MSRHRLARFACMRRLVTCGGPLQAVPGLRKVVQTVAAHQQAAPEAAHCNQESSEVKALRQNCTAQMQGRQGAAPAVE